MADRFGEPERMKAAARRGPSGIAWSKAGPLKQEAKKIAGS